MEGVRISKGKMMSYYRRRNIRGFKLGRKIIRVFKWVTRFRRNSCKYHKLGGSTSTMQRSKGLSKLLQWGRKIKLELLKPGSNRDYIRLGRPVQVPKGQLAVYVGESDGDTRRVLVPVVFLNHPLFENLLKEAERVYGFDHPGRIMIPCPISEFENVKTRIAESVTKCRSPMFSCVPSLRCLST